MPQRLKAPLSCSLLIATLVYVTSSSRVVDAKTVVETVDVRAFGDSAYVGGTGVYAAPPKDWVAKSLYRIVKLRSPDVNFLNLEGALSRACRKFSPKPFTFAVAPEALIEFGKWGFNLVSLANNHSLDCVDPSPSVEIGPALAEVALGAPDMRLHGVAPTAAQLSAQIATLTVRGITIGMVSIKGWENGRRALVANLNNRGKILRALKDAKVDVRVLSLHGGIENSRRPNDAVMDLAREFISRYDGDVVFAHHPHKSQGFELLTKPNGRAAAVFYSLGNFLHNGLSVSGDGLMARIAVSKAGLDIDSVAAYPLANASLEPRPVTRAQLKEIGIMLRDSNAAIALKALPHALKRRTFELEPTFDPAPGFKLVPGGIPRP